MTDPTNAARQARFRRMRASGLQYVSGYLPPKRAMLVHIWMSEAERSAEASDSDVSTSTKAGSPMI